MTGWLILLGIFLFFVFLFLLPVTAVVSYREQIQVTVRYALLRFQIAPPKEKRSRKKEKAGKKKKEKPGVVDRLRTLIEEQGLSGFLSLISEIVKAMAGGIRKLLRHLTVDQLVINQVVVGENAADTAILYGRTGWITYGAIAVLSSVFRIRVKAISVVPDFTEGAESKASFSGKIRIRLFWLFCIGIGLLYKLLVTLVKKKLQSKNYKEGGVSA